ncbi:hypothetical protein PTHTG4_27220 [Parageobacillus thermoglucosidasius]|uniref:tail fiber protein n=1 Tax=Parageobacillus thermoglucosidasius TaxID=1426 RepID=UPI000FF92632|nr:tail fiber protein [Parageobacillus thermoglucosidasius]GCD83658.1 hypothetical protein PTHTG4_27220 [Parageobacillus thermoglucosidasius]
MASNTPRLGLYKKDPVADANDTFNIQTMLNDNWDKIDSKVATLEPDGKIPAEQLPQQSLPTASTTQAGIVKLNTSTNSTSTTEAATPSAVKDVNDALAAHSADNAAHGIGDKSTLLTSNKNTIVEAINELFTFANSGKSSVASAIGSPASSGDTFSQLATHIINHKTSLANSLGSGSGSDSLQTLVNTRLQGLKNTLATNLTNKGQTANGSETLLSLINKVANVNTGKRWASGSGVPTGNVLTVTNLSFTPRYAIAIVNGYVAANYEGTTSVFSNSVNSYIANTYIHFRTNGLDIYFPTSGSISWIAFE